MDAENRRPQQEEFDSWLDTALGARANAEPRPGLEDRVLTRLAAEPERTKLAWWPAMTAVAAVFVIAIALLIMRSGDQAKPIAKRGENSTTSQPVGHQP